MACTSLAEWWDETGLDCNDKKGRSKKRPLPGEGKRLLSESQIVRLVRDVEVEVFLGADYQTHILYCTGYPAVKVIH